MSHKLLIVTLLFTITCTIPLTPAQKRGRTPQTSRQQPPKPPSAQQKSEAELQYEKEMSVLKALTVDQKASLGDAIWRMDQAQRAWMLTFDARRFRGDLRYITPSVKAATDLLPEGNLRLSIMSGFVAMNDSLTAFDFALSQRDVDRMMEIINRYQIKSTNPTEITAIIIKTARAFIDKAQELATAASIPLISRRASSQSNTAIATPSVPACNLTLAQAPEIRGFRLSMTADEVLARFPRLEIKPATEANFKPELGYTEARISAADIMIAYPSLKTEFKGISRIELKFLDKRVTSISIEYDDSSKWRDTDDFLSNLIPSLKLPELSRWQTDPRFGEQSDIKQLVCTGFKMTVMVLGRAHIMLDDPTALATVSKRAKEQEENKRREFKP